MGWWSKVRKRLSRWAKAATLGNTIEALIKGGNVWKAFWKDQVIVPTEIFRLIDDFFPTYETFYDNQTVGIFKDPFKCNTLTNVIAGSIFSHTDLQDMLRDASLNSLVNRANAYCKKVKKSELYKDFHGAIYYESPDEDETAIWLSGVLGIPLFDEENTPETYMEIAPATYEDSNYIGIAYNYLREHYQYDGSYLVYEGKTYFIEDAEPEDSNNLKLTIVHKDSITNGGYTSYTQITREYLTIPVTTYEGKYCRIQYLCGSGDTINYTSDYWIALDDPACPEFIKNKYAEQVNKVSEYLMPLRLRTGGKAIQQDDDEFKENEKLFKIFGIDFVDIAKCINADVSILNRRSVKNNRKDDKNQQEADVNYIANLEKVTSAFLFFGLELSEDSQEANEYFFKYFKWLENVNETGSEEIDYKEYGYKISFDGINVTEEKNASKNNYPTKYGKKLIKETSYAYNIVNGKTVATQVQVDSLLIWHWKDSRTVEKVVVTNLGSSNYNGGWRGVSLADGINAEEDDDKGNFYIPINMAVLRRLGQFKGSDVLKASIRVVYNSSTKIRKKWYATTWFTVVRIIASIVVIIVTWGSSTPFVLAANAAANVAINIAIQILITIAIRLAVKYICKIFNIPAEYAGIISMAVNMAVSIYTGGMSFSGGGMSIAGTTVVGMAIGNIIADSAVDGKHITMNSIADNLGAAAAASAGGAIMGYAGAPATMLGNAVYGAAQAVITSAISLAFSSSFYNMLQTGDYDDLYITGAMSAIGGALGGAASFNSGQSTQTKPSNFRGSASNQLYTEKVMYTPTGTVNSNSLGSTVSGSSLTDIGINAWSAYNQRQINKKYQKIQDAMLSLNKKEKELQALLKSVDDMKSKVTPEILKAYSHDYTDITINTDNSFSYIKDFDLVLANVHNLASIILSKGRTKNNNSPILQVSYFNA